MKSHDVRFWEIRPSKPPRRRSYEVRWTVAGRQKSKSFAKRALAEAFRAELIAAAGRGAAFDVVSGLPESITRPVTARTWFHFAQSYVDAKWARAAAKSRDSMTDALATVTPALVANGVRKPDPAALRRALRGWALPPAMRGVAAPPEVDAVLRWLEKASLPMPALADATVVRTALDALALRMDGQPAAAETVRRKRAVFYNALRYAVEVGELAANPIDRIAWVAPKVADAVDRRVVVNPAQARQLLAAVTLLGRNRGRRLMAMFACMYFAALRPAEAVALREADCLLPEQGWGQLTLTRTLPSSNKQWTDSGEVHDPRGLKHRGRREARIVPIPPELVEILREHIAEFGVAQDGRIFASRTGRVVSSSSYWRVWREARLIGLSPDQAASPMAGRPYDLRHAAVSTWLNAGVPATEVAERAGHTVDVLLKIYAKCIDGQTEIVNRRIEEALR
jgi:integrase